jgi:hypothetical protein
VQYGKPICSVIGFQTTDLHLQSMSVNGREIREKMQGISFESTGISQEDYQLVENAS